jgi:hypothetical protein
MIILAMISVTYNCFLFLTSDTATAMGLLRRILMQDDLTDKEKKTLKRTLTDMASVIPIGILMLLPVSCAYFNAFFYKCMF